MTCYLGSRLELFEVRQGVETDDEYTIICFCETLKRAEEIMELFEHKTGVEYYIKHVEIVPSTELLKCDY